MLKLIISLLIITTIQVKVFSQNDNYFSTNHDSVSFFISCNGLLTTSKDAVYKRVVRFDNEKLAFIGNVHDYYMNGSIALKAFYKNGLYDGLFSTYYPDGKIKEEGRYLANIRDSIWCYYYKNGSIEKKIDFSNQQIRLIEYYKKNSKPMFLDGNGIYKGQSNKDYYSCDCQPIKGEIKNGLMVGRWTINLGYSISTEVFEDGKFIRGHESPHNRTYESNPLISIVGFPYYENIVLLNYSFRSNKLGLFYPIYDNIPFADSFLRDLRKAIKDSLVKNNNSFFYALIQFRLENGKIEPNSLISVTNESEIFESLKKIILTLDKWNKSENNVSFTIYLPIFWENENIYLKPDDLNIFN